MPFIGNQPALSYTSFAKQDFTTSATTSYTLDNPVANENEIALFINFVRQEPTTAYTASGTSLTLTSATSASDDMYCVYLGKAVQTVNPPNGSVGASQIADSSIALGKLSATGTKDATTFLRGDNTFASAGGDNTPAFLVTRSSSQTFNEATDTKVQFNNEVYDTDNTFDSSTNYRWTPGITGKVFMSAGADFSAGSSNAFHMRIMIFKNGTEVTRVHRQTTDYFFPASTVQDMTISLHDSCTPSDYYEVYVNGNNVSGNNDCVVGSRSGTYSTHFGGYKIID